MHTKSKGKHIKSQGERKQKDPNQTLSYNIDRNCVGEESDCIETACVVICSIIEEEDVGTKRLVCLWERKAFSLVLQDNVLVSAPTSEKSEAGTETKKQRPRNNDQEVQTEARKT